MMIPMNILLFVVGAGIVQSVFLATLIYFHPKADRSVNKFLAFYILSFCIPMLIPLVQHYFSWQILIFFHPFILLTAPMLYLYVRSFKEKVTWKRALPHFILFFLFVAFDLHMYFTVAIKYPPAHDVPAEIIGNPLSRIRVIVRISQMFTYYYLAGRVLTTYQRSIQQLFSETSRINLRWVRWLINGFLLLIILMAVLYATIIYNPDQFALIILINTALVTPYIYVATFKGVTQPTLWQTQSGFDKEMVFQELKAAEQIESAVHEIDLKTAKQALQLEKIDAIVSKTISLMEKEKIYVQTELTLQDLADKLDVPSYQVSLAINEGLQKTFYDLVNGYRVEEAKRLLLDPLSRGNKILTVAFDAGFNSKTTFNTVFKKFTGFTPTEYKDQHQQEVARI